MKITFLGTGTSCGVPQLGCDCEVCRSTDPRDTRLRTSVLVEVNEQLRILVDCGPDFRYQMLRHGFKPFQAVLITHEHYDHVGGIDDLRPYSLLGRVPIFADALCASHLRERLPYCFGEHLYPGVPQVDLQSVTPYQSFDVGGAQVTPLLAYHDRLPILGYRINNLGYLTDVTRITDETAECLMDVPLLVVDALRHKPHHSHLTLEQAIEMSRRLRAKRTYFVHMSHDMGLHAQVEATLSENMHLAYDGLEINVD